MKGETNNRANDSVSRMLLNCLLRLAHLSIVVWRRVLAHCEYQHVPQVKGFLFNEDLELSESETPYLNEFIELFEIFDGEKRLAIDVCYPEGENSRSVVLRTYDARSAYQRVWADVITSLKQHPRLFTSIVIKRGRIVKGYIVHQHADDVYESMGDMNEKIQLRLDLALDSDHDPFESVAQVLRVHYKRLVSSDRLVSWHRKVYQDPERQINKTDVDLYPDWQNISDQVLVDPGRLDERLPHYLFRYEHKQLATKFYFAIFQDGHYQLVPSTEPFWTLVNRKQANFYRMRYYPGGVGEGSGRCPCI